MLKWILILLVPGAIFLSSLSDSSNPSKISPTPVQVQNVVPQTQTIEKSTTVQTEQKTEAVQNTKPSTIETAKVVPKPATTNITTCGEDYYVNINGNCVHRPSDNPSGASARCRDGSYSYSQNRRGTCSGHGGVATWY